MIQPSELPVLNTSPAKGEDLHEAFNTFNQLSKQLTESYQILETRVTGLNTELAATRNERIKELTEKERLAKRLTLLINALPGGVVVLDGQGIIQECNPIAIDLLGEPLMGQQWIDIINRSFVSQQSGGQEIILNDGRSINLSTCPLGDEPGQILLLTDVSEMRKLQEQLNHNQRLATMGETAASLAHQIRTPLSSVMLYASKLKRTRMENDERISLTKKIFSRLHHLEQLISNMLLYSRGVPVFEDKINVTELITALHHSIEAHLEEKSVEFLIDSKIEANTCIEGNYQMLLSALLNLCTNSIHAIEADGTIQIRLNASTENTLQINIIDNGPGIAMEDQTAMFEPFVTSKQNGTGLGLAVVKAVVQSHQGTITVKSGIGQGCDISITLPAISNECETHLQKEKFNKIQNIEV
jgi:two-component system sensor histidine kinase FlrB